MTNSVTTGSVWVAFYCTWDFILGKMGWKQGDHSERYIQVSYDSHLTTADMVTRMGLWFHFDSSLSSICFLLPSPSASLTVLPFGSPGG